MAPLPSSMMAPSWQAISTTTAPSVIQVEACVSHVHIAMTQLQHMSDSRETCTSQGQAGGSFLVCFNAEAEEEIVCFTGLTHSTGWLDIQARASIDAE